MTRASPGAVFPLAFQTSGTSTPTPEEGMKSANKVAPIAMARDRQSIMLQRRISTKFGGKSSQFLRTKSQLGRKSTLGNETEEGDATMLDFNILEGNSLCLFSSTNKFRNLIFDFTTESQV